MAEPANSGTLIDDFEAAKSNLAGLMEKVANSKLHDVGGFTEKGLKERYQP